MRFRFRPAMVVLLKDEPRPEVADPHLPSALVSPSSGIGISKPSSETEVEIVQGRFLPAELGISGRWEPTLQGKLHISM